MRTSPSALSKAPSEVNNGTGDCCSDHCTATATAEAVAVLADLVRDPSVKAIDRIRAASVLVGLHQPMVDAVEFSRRLDALEAAARQRPALELVHR